MTSDSEEPSRTSEAAISDQMGQKREGADRGCSYTAQQLLSLRLKVPDKTVEKIATIAREKIDDASTVSPHGGGAENDTVFKQPVIGGNNLTIPGKKLQDSKDNDEAVNHADGGIHPTSPEKEVKDNQNTQSESDNVREPTTNENLPRDEEQKKKKKKKSSGKNKKPNPTGFEEFYADPPLTTSEYNEELYDVYCNSRSFIERIEQCIQRYRSRRKLDEIRANVFNKYLTLGGIDTSIRAFTGGLDQDTLENSTASEIAALRAQDHIRGNTNSKYYDPNKAEHWVVDFEGVAKGFLAPEAFGRDSPVVKTYCAVVRNFLNYVTYHGVCPEYTNNILKAKMVCDRAEKELPIINEVGKLLPGDFNMAASTLYGGYYHNMYISPGTWGSNECEDETGHFPRSNRRYLTGMTIAEADRIFKTAIAFTGSYEMFKAMDNAPQVIKTTFRSMEIVNIALPTPEKKHKYAGVKDSHGRIGQIRPLGILTVKTWNNARAENEDLTEDEEAAAVALRKKTSTEEDPREDFWLEEEVLEKCFVGMKLEAIVRELDIGVKYFDSICGVYPSFFTYLPADRLHGWREPVLNTRPPRSAENPMGAEDDADIGFD